MKKNSKDNIKPVLNVSMDVANNTTTGGMSTKITKSNVVNAMVLVARISSVLNLTAIAKAKSLTPMKMLIEESSDQLKLLSVTS